MREKIGPFGAIPSGDFRTRTAYYRGGSPPFRRPATAEKQLHFNEKMLSSKNLPTPTASKQALQGDMRIR